MRSNERWRKHRIGGLAQPHRDIVEIFALDPLGQPVARFRDDVLGQHPAARPDDRRQADRIIALAGADIGDRHAGRDAGQPHDFLGLARPGRGHPRSKSCRRRSARRRGRPSGNALRLRLRPAGGKRQAASRSEPTALVDILDFHLFAGHALRQGGGHEPVEIAVEHVRRRGRSDAGAQVLHQLIGLQHIAADLVAPADVGLGRVGGIGLRLALLQLGLVEPRLQLLDTPAARFLCCDRSFWQATTIPVGMWVIRTALSVVLTCCPPAPDAR